MLLFLFLTACTDEKPTLSELAALKTPVGDKIKIIKRLTHMWKSVGDLLNFDSGGSELLAIEDANRGNNEASCRDMFQMWIMGNGVRPCSWGKLIEIIKDCEMEALAEEIEAALQ